MIPKRYLGDAVFVEVDDDAFALTVEDDEIPITIYLTDAMVEALLRFYADVVRDRRCAEET
jgi:hypothetical protein